MGIQERNDISIKQFLLSGSTHVRDGQVIAQDAGRATALVNRTVMAQYSSGASKGKWVPLTDVTAVTDGSDYARGIYVGEDIAAASLVAGDVANNNIIVSGPCTLDKDLLVLENSLTLETQCDRNLDTIEDMLIKIGIIPEATEYVSEVENS